MNRRRRLPAPVAGLLCLCLCLAGVAVGAAGCSSGNAPAAAAAPGASSTASAAGGGQSAGGSPVAGLPDYSAICPKLPVADAQQLVRGTLPPAVADLRLGGCTFVLPGQKLADNNLTVAFQTGADASSLYSDGVKGIVSIGGSTMTVGMALTNPLTGVGAKAMWGSDAGYPTVSALKGDVYCSVSTGDDATKLTIIGGPGNPLPHGSQAQQAQYAQLEGKLCTDLFAVVQ